MHFPKLLILKNSSMMMFKKKYMGQNSFLLYCSHILKQQKILSVEPNEILFFSSMEKQVILRILKVKHSNSTEDRSAI